MGCTEEELGARITSAEMTNWIAFYQLEPWGCLADDQRAALICKVIADGLMQRSDGKPWEISDFMFDRYGLKQQKSNDAGNLLEMARMITTVLQEQERMKDGG